MGCDMLNGSGEMMFGYGLFGWLIMLLVIVVLVLLIAWLIKNLQCRKR